MTDGCGREITYLRLSVTDRCQLRCRYCMPEEGVEPLAHSDILSYEEMLRIARVMAGLGVKKVRVTGGEPLVRRGLPLLIAGLKETPGIAAAALTTNGLALADELPSLLDAGLDAVNISIDTVDEGIFEAVTRRSGVARVIEGIDAARGCAGLKVKLNCVPTQDNRAGLAQLALFAAEKGLPLRFIELMPIGCGKNVRGLREDETMAVLKAALGEPKARAQDANEKTTYFDFPGGVSAGFISPISRPFCARCDRIRLTAEGRLKTCLQYDDGADLRALLSGTDEALAEAIKNAVAAKPAGHHFGGGSAPDDETRAMWQIGG